VSGRAYAGQSQSTGPRTVRAAGRRVTHPQRERIARRAVRAQVPDPVLGLAGAGTMSGGHPPARQLRLAHPLEPLPAPPQHLPVHLAEHERAQVLGVRPDGHVDDDAGTACRVPLEGLDRGRVPLLGLQPPDEAGCPVSGGVDRVECRHETSQFRRVQRSGKPGDVDLRELECHRMSLPAPGLGGRPSPSDSGGSPRRSRSRRRGRHSRRCSAGTRPDRSHRPGRRCRPDARAARRCRHLWWR